MEEEVEMTAAEVDEVDVEVEVDVEGAVEGGGGGAVMGYQFASAFNCLSQHTLPPFTSTCPSTSDSLPSILALQI